MCVARAGISTLSGGSSVVGFLRLLLMYDNQTCAYVQDISARTCLLMID